MENLNELVELAKNATQGEWTTDIRGSVIAADDQANNGFVICAASGCDKSNNVEFIAAANPKTILAIAKAYRALEQRAEAAEAKLAGLAKQRNPDYFLNRIESSDKWGPGVELRIYESQLDASKSQDDHGGGIIELFTRPARAADLAELVPDELTREAWRQLFINEDYQDTFRCGFSACRAAILRNIEEVKK